MSKKTTRKQLEIMLNKMQLYPDIACGMPKGGKDELKRFWRNLETELNLAGPPTKHVIEWKKVWCDQKKYVRQKAAQNLKAPNKFSRIEEAIYDLIKMKESRESAATAFGLGNSSHAIKQSDDNIEVVLPDDEMNTVDEINMSENLNECSSTHLFAQKIKTDPTELPAHLSSPDMITQEKNIQQNILEAMREQLQSTKRMHSSIDRLCDLKREELIELKRHNNEMEKLRSREVEDKIIKNEKLLELLFY